MDLNFTQENERAAAICEYAFSDRFFASLDSPSLEFSQNSLYCADKLHFQIKLSSDNEITKVRYSGSACTLALTSAYLFADFCEKHKKLSKIYQDIKNFSENDCYRSNSDIVFLLEILQLEKLAPQRKKCVMTCWENALKKFSVLIV
jgi:NifU-like protein involved in Fe-S cluster formation